MTTSLALTLGMIVPFMIWAGFHYLKCIKKRFPTAIEKTQRTWVLGYVHCKSKNSKSKGVSNNR